MPWVPLLKTSDLPPGTSAEIVAEDRIVALFNVEGKIYALDGVCPHQGGPLGKGKLTGCLVTCPWHGWQFDVRSGQNTLSARTKQPSFAVRVESETILVDLSQSSEPSDVASDVN